MVKSLIRSDEFTQIYQLEASREKMHELGRKRLEIFATKDAAG
jgi:hypothetical protein